MSDTKIQINNSRNKEITDRLNRLYKQQKSIRTELEFVKNWKKEGRKYLSYGSYKRYEIDWNIYMLRSDLEINQSTIKMVRSKLVIC